MAHPQVIFSAAERFPNIYIHTYNVNLPYHVQPHLCHDYVKAQQKKEFRALIPYEPKILRI